MLIIPEIETVVILTPRTGSGSLRRALLEKYPLAMLLYRHMEADGVPAGYDRWPRVGVVRNPIERLWSLYKFLRAFDGDHDPAYIKAMRDSVQPMFSDWILNNEIVFTSPYDRAGRNRYFANYTVRHPVPENRKSQWVYLRPDLGTTVYAYKNYDALAERLRVAPEAHHNCTESLRTPVLTRDAHDYMYRQFAWDFSVA